MPSEASLAEPWWSFLDDIDRSTATPLTLTCIGGFAGSLLYGLTKRLSHGGIPRRRALIRPDEDIPPPTPHP
jgi:hypothetical protein